MKNSSDWLSTPSCLDAAQGAGEEQTKLYLNTAKEYRNRQRSSAPRAAGAAGFAGWQGGVTRVVG